MNELYPIIKITTSNKILYDYFVNNSIKFYNNENISVEYMGISRIDTKLMFKIKDVSYSNIPLIDIFNEMEFLGQQFYLDQNDIEIMRTIEDHYDAYINPDIKTKTNIDILMEYDKFIRNFKLDNILNNVVYSDIQILNIVEDYLNTQHPFMSLNDFKNRRNYILEKLIEKKI